MHLRLLPYTIADGAANMAADETLLRSAAGGVASLRFYGWSAATVSLGYFQAHAVHAADPILSKLPWVRRPSGGATLVHHHELTYALAVPAGGPWHSGESWLLRMHRIIVAALEQFGLAEGFTLVEDKAGTHANHLCFHQFTVGDVVCSGSKVVGSAQRKHRQALMQHGSILLAQSEYAPSLPGIRELLGVDLPVEALCVEIAREMGRQTGWSFDSPEWTESEQAEIQTLSHERYESTVWNRRR